MQKDKKKTKVVVKSGVIKLRKDWTNLAPELTMIIEKDKITFKK